MTTELLKSAYFHHRARAMNPARAALAAARDDVSAYQAAMAAKDTARAARVRRYSSSPWVKPYGAVTWQPVDDRARERFAFVDDPEAAGLRFVGRASIEGRRDAFDSRESEGWLTDPYGDVFRDGSGLCWGEVYQLPGRNGRARFVAGYQHGGCGDGLMVDLGNVFEAERGDSYWDGSPQDIRASREAAYAADEHARVAADREREYQAAWRAGSQWAQLGEEIAELRRGIREAIAQFKEARAALGDEIRFSRLCQLIRSDVGDDLEEIARIRAERDELAGGNADPLIFYPSDELRAAFADGAGISPASQL